ncbi:cofG, partial [Symbiodinium sp. KB8]
DPDTAALTLQHQKVDAAIQAGDQYVAYKVLKQLRPWQPSQKAQLKDNFVELPLLATTTLAKHIASIKPVHKTIRSRRDLKLAHDLIQALLEAVGRLRLRVNPAKCSIMVRLSGTEAPSVTRRHTCWLPDASGELKKHWRIGPNKAYPAFRQEGQIKYLGIIISYSNYELLTLRHRLAEASKKIQQVRKYIYNRRIASPAARLRVWFATVWATAVTGLPEVGLSPESARLLRGWYAQQLCSVLNQPAHITHVTTADLLQLHKLQDPVDKIIRRMKGRIAKLRKRSRVVSEAAEDVALHSHILIDLDRILQEAQALPVATSATLEPAYRCHICQAAFDTAHGLRMHTAKMHRDSLSRFIPPIFDRELHAKEGMPVCVACNRSFKQWKGLRDHLLSGACPAPDALRTITSSGTLSSSGFEMLQLQELRREVQSSTRSQLATQAALPSAQILQHRCVVCGFWTPDHTKVKSHIRQAHPQVWQETGLLVLATDTPLLHDSGTWSGTTSDSGDSVLKRLFPPANTAGHADLYTGYAGTASAATDSFGG